MKRKGISPLIAAVLLIAFTMAVAAILTAWVTSFTQSTTEGVGNESERLIQCSYGGLTIYSATLDTGASTFRASIGNTGTRDFNNVTVVLFHTNGNTNLTFTGALSSGDVQTVTINPGVSSASSLENVRATAVDCPEVSAEESDINEQ